MVTGPGSGDPSSTATCPLKNTGDVMVGEVLVEGVPVVGVVRARTGRARAGGPGRGPCAGSRSCRARAAWLLCVGWKNQEPGCNHPSCQSGRNLEESCVSSSARNYVIPRERKM